MGAEIETLLQNLQNWGCNVDEALDRFLGEKELYQQCLETVLCDKAFGELKDALNEGSIKEAFEAAHTLKGVLANLGLTPMYDTIEKIVEPLRAGEIAGLMPFYEELFEEKSYLGKLLKAE